LQRLDHWSELSDHMSCKEKGNLNGTGKDIRYFHRGHYLILVVILSVFLFSILPDSRAQFSVTLTPSSVDVNSKSVFEISAVAGDTVAAGSEIVLYAPAGILQLAWPLFSNIYVSSTGQSVMEITSMVSARIAQPPIWDNDNLPTLIFVRVNNQPLLPGEVVNFTLGNDDFGDLFLVQAPVTAGFIQFKLAVISPDGEWTEMAKFPLELTALDAASVRLFVPSVAETGSAFRLRAVAWDVLYNRAKAFTGRLRVLPGEDELFLPEEIVFTPGDSGYVELDAGFQQEGTFAISAELIQAENAVGGLQAGQVIRSNFSWVRDDPEYYIFWGDLHSHSGWSKDGQGTMSFEYARYTSCLDYFAPAEHVNGHPDDTFGISEEEWTRIKDYIIEYHDPGVFIPVTAYETSYRANEGGHHIVYFEHSDNSIHDIPLLPRQTYRTVFDIIDQLDQLPPHISALYFPHFTGEFNYTAPSDPEWGLDELSINQGDIPRLVGEEYISPYRTVFEIYSDHGQSEVYDPGHPLNGSLSFWFVQDALAMGEKLGFTAYTDNHLAKPGYPGSGKGAIMVPELSRSAVFQALRDRKVYATTGDRIIMDFRVNDTIMGGIVDINIDMVPQIELMFNDTATIERIEVLKWDFMEGTYGDDYHPDFETIREYDFTDGTIHFEDDFLDMDFYGHAVYYLRVMQENEVRGKPVWAWSSPVWVNNLNLDTTITYVDALVREAGIRVSPNPVARNGMLVIEVASGSDTDVLLAVFDRSGLLHRINNGLLAGGSNILKIPVAGLAAGQYWLRLTDRLGNWLGASSFVIQ
jgi:hypothetical protein